MSNLPHIGTQHNDATRNILNNLIDIVNSQKKKYEDLHEDSQKLIRDTERRIDDNVRLLIDRANKTTEDLQNKADALNDESKSLQERIDLGIEYAKEINQKNVDVQQQLDNIILESGTSDAELVQARGDYELLKDRFENNEKYIHDVSQGIHEYSYSNYGMRAIQDNKPRLTIQDDDVREGLYTKLYPWAKEKGIVIVSALISNLIDTPDHITYEQFKEMKESGVVQFVNHTHNHLRLNELSKKEIHEEIKLCEEFLEKEGIYTKHLVYPYGAISDEVKTIASQYVHSATKSNSRPIFTNESLLDHYQINRMVLEVNLNRFKERIDEAIDNNGNIIINTHTHYDEFDLDKLDEIIDIAIENGMEIVDYTTLFRSIANPLEISRDGDLVLGISSNGYYVNKNEPEMPEIPEIPSIPDDAEIFIRINKDDFNLTPEDEIYKYPEKVSFVDITRNKSIELGWDFIDGEFKPAILYTYRTDSDAGHAFAYQELTPIRSMHVYKRHWDSTGVGGRWTEWYRLTGTPLSEI